MPEKKKAKAVKPRRPSTPSTKPDALGFRLPRTIEPRAYRIHVHVDPARDDRYHGEVEIDLEATAPFQRVELHAVDLVLTDAAIRQGGRSTPATLEPHPERETVVIVSPVEHRAKKATVKLSFAGTLRTDLRGLYRARSGTRTYAVSQLEAADARRFFPCFDEPAFKARFSMRVTTRRTHTVISNTPIARREDLGDDEQLVAFEPTPLLSTYLVALAVGELECSAPVYAGDVPIRIVHVPGNAHLTELALHAARECLLRLSAYFALPYPYAKLDLVAVPDFEIGAMENAGAVFFRETLLLIDDGTVSLPERKRAVEVICHELAHMWYGNLVTMQWWDDLWLNEAFATWMAFDIVAKWRPAWKMWNDFGHSRNSALHLDALDNTHAIYTEVRTPAEATESFDLITYEKGAAVVRMLERYLGPAVFRKGVRTYIRRHREGNTVARDLWRALGEAAKQDVEKVVRAFIEEPGFPLVRMRKTRSAKGASLVVTQERFCAHGEARAQTMKPNARAARESWSVPLVLRAGKSDKAGQSELVRHLLTRGRDRIALPSRSSFVYGNAEEGGFYRPLHDAADLPELIASFQELSTSERLGLLHRQWALARAGYATVTSFLELLPALASETDADVLRAVVGPCDHLIDHANVAGPSVRESLQAFVAVIWKPELVTLGYDRRPEDDDDTRLLRAELYTLVASLAEDEDASRAAEERCRAYLDDERAIDPNLVAQVLALGARRADGERLERYIERSVHASTPQERRRFRMALADVRGREAIKEVHALCLGERIPTQDVALVLARMLGNRDARAATWTFVKARWQEVRARMPAMLVSRMIEATPALFGEPNRRDVASFFGKHPVKTAARALRQADERFLLEAAFWKRAAPELRKWHAARARGRRVGSKRA